MASSSTNIPSKIKLPSGYEIPSIGFGTWMISSDEMDRALSAALEIGYRYIDTFMMFGNNEAIGQSLERFLQKGGKREELFVSARIPGFGNRPADVEKYLKLLLKNLRIDYLDMFMIGLPWGLAKDPARDENPDGFLMHENGTCVLEFDTDLVAIYEAMESLVDKSLVRSLGLSNMNESQILKIASKSRIKPSEVLIEGSIYRQMHDFKEHSKDYNFAITLHSPLGARPASKMLASKRDPSTVPDPLQDPVVLEIAKKHNKTPGQIILRHGVQQGFVVLPDCADESELESNFRIFDFELTQNELQQLNKLDRGDEGRLWDSYNLPGVEAHPEYPYPT
ncbi:hypothetical protein QAD02_009975 [Eretmocerus hayati]|uniref:Uncharacterized protein n=1 Tax=Eretmocerus hayati TaxID=131215 RepID=A0ACC2NAW3_9HYME|nr:hypothetical protein QAD02_009975 [Eretmocerus hayati]